MALVILVPIPIDRLASVLRHFALARQVRDPFRGLLLILVIVLANRDTPEGLVARNDHPLGSLMRSFLANRVDRITILIAGVTFFLRR